MEFFEGEGAFLYCLIAVGLLVSLFSLIRAKRLPWKFRARVVYVCDGDSIWVRTWYLRRIKLRLQGMDAPETEQRYGAISQRVLERLIKGKIVNVEAVDRDIYGRYVSKVVYRGNDISLRMIEEGMAWPYFKFFGKLSQNQQAEFYQAWEVAKQNKVGIWKDKNPTPPWVWRAQHRSLWQRFLLWIRRILGII